jgi:hypothetical protein
MFIVRNLVIVMLMFLSTAVWPGSAVAAVVNNPANNATLAKNIALPATTIVLPQYNAIWQQQSFVIIGPYIGLPRQFSGNDLLVNSPKINTDIVLLDLRKSFLLKDSDPNPDAHLILSGNLEGAMQYRNNDRSPTVPSFAGNKSSLNLENAELDFLLFMPSPWLTGFMAVEYDDRVDYALSNSKLLNSRLYLDRAFVTVGNLLSSPFYGSFGQMYMPFGKYSSAFISSSLPKKLARTKARALLLGYKGQDSNAFYSQIYAFQGDSYSVNSTNINNGGINLGYRFTAPQLKLSGDIASSWIANIADSITMQATGQRPLFNGFSGPQPYGNERLSHRVPAIDFRTKLAINDVVTIIAEYVRSTTAFNINDLSYGNKGAQPTALNTEISYALNGFSRPTAISVMYGKTSDALAIGLPEYRYGVVLNTSIWRNTLQSIELRHDINYGQNKYATGSNITPVIYGLGANDNVVSLQFDVYF